MMKRYCIVLTGGPGGGKSTLIEELRQNHDYASRMVFLPEAISLMPEVGISPDMQLFQRVMVHLQWGLEDGLMHALGNDKHRAVICHRGSLDPLAYWLDRGWPLEAFFTFTNTYLDDHYRRYTAVIHLVTSADGASSFYTRWPESHRPETIEQAVHLDQLLHQVWSGHPHYYYIDNQDFDWNTKSREVRTIIDKLIDADEQTF